MSTLTIYRDSSASAVFMEDANGAQFLNSLHASLDDSDLVVITDTARSIELVSGVVHSNILDDTGTAYTGTAEDVCNTLNAIFSVSGTAFGNLPNITSSLAVTLTQGDTLNYELLADYAVGYEWDFSSVSGVTTVEGNPRKLIGGSTLTVGTYNIPVKAINYSGEDSETLVLTVSSPPFSDTKSVNFNNSDYLGANASLLDAVLGRAGNGAGAGDAWSVSLWFKPGTSSNSNQTIWYFGDQDVANNGYIQLKYDGGSSNKNLVLRYGTNNNLIQLVSPTSTLTVGNWHHILISYDGGTTGSSSADLSDYYSRFNIYVDGVSQTLTGSHSNFGYTGAISGQNFRIARWNNGQSLRNNCRVNEFAVWGSDQSSNIADIYNSGSRHDLSLLTTSPDHWWRMGDGDTYPNIQDNVGTAHFVMYNMTAADIVNDV